MWVQRGSSSPLWESSVSACAVVAIFWFRKRRKMAPMSSAALTLQRGVIKDLGAFTGIKTCAGGGTGKGTMEYWGFHYLGGGFGSPLRFTAQVQICPVLITELHFISLWSRFHASHSKGPNPIFPISLYLLCVRSGCWWVTRGHGNQTGHGNQESQDTQVRLGSDDQP